MANEIRNAWNFTGKRVDADVVKVFLKEDCDANLISRDYFAGCVYYKSLLGTVRTGVHVEVSAYEINQNSDNRFCQNVLEKCGHIVYVVTDNINRLLINDMIGEKNGGLDILSDLKAMGFKHESWDTTDSEEDA